MVSSSKRWFLLISKDSLFAHSWSEKDVLILKEYSDLSEETEIHHWLSVWIFQAHGFFPLTFFKHYCAQNSQNLSVVSVWQLLLLYLGCRFFVNFSLTRYLTCLIDFARALRLQHLSVILLSKIIWATACWNSRYSIFWNQMVLSHAFPIQDRWSFLAYEIQEAHPVLDFF